MRSLTNCNCVRNASLSGKYSCKDLKCPACAPAFDEYEKWYLFCDAEGYRKDGLTVAKVFPQIEPR